MNRNFIKGQQIKRYTYILILIFTACSLPLISNSAQAVSITGGSTILDLTNAGQLQTWLGEGEIALNNIFSYRTGDGQTTQDFHSAADGQGRTFSVFSITSVGYETPIVFGGYNPQSWSSIGNYHYTYNDADRTAFIFNLNNNVRWDQILSTDVDGYRGERQTYNDAHYGPTFGGGHDLTANYSDSGLDFSYNYPYSYGPYDNHSGHLPGITGLSRTETYWIDYGGSNQSNRDWQTVLEIFTITNDGSAPAVPEPTTMILLGTGLLGLAGARRNLNQKDQ